MIHSTQATTPVKETPDSLLAESAYFSGTSSTILAELLRQSTDEKRNQGEIIVKEGETGSCVYLILQGSTEVSLQNETLAQLYAGDWIGAGNAALIPASWIRTATVTANEATRLLRIDAKVFNALIESHPNLKTTLSENREEISRHLFIKNISLFNPLSREKINTLFSAIEKISVAQGTDIITEGDVAHECYFIYEGAVEVSTGTPSRVIATLKAGHLFGEMSILSEKPRNATVTAKTSCQLLVLKKKDLQDILLECAGFSASISSFLLQRSRPVIADNIEILHRFSSDKQKITLLKNTETLSFFQLTEEGLFVWQRLDGQRTLRELIEEYLFHFKTFNLAHVSNLIMRLSVAGFVHIPKMSIAHAEAKISFLRRATNKCKNFFEFHFILQGMKEKISRLFHRFHLSALYSPLGCVLMLILGAIGFGLFLNLTHGSLSMLRYSSYSWFFLLSTLPLRLVSIVLHELGHAFMTLRYKQPLKAVGIGWYWFSPIAYIDTSSMWSLPNKPRIMVDLAGILSDWMFSGALMIIAAISKNPTFITLTFLFALLSYLNILSNLNPLIKLDGYYLLMDMLDEPNLRARCTHWLVKTLRGNIAYNKTALLYWGISLLYIASIISILYTLRID